MSEKTMSSDGAVYGHLKTDFYDDIRVLRLLRDLGFEGGWGYLRLMAVALRQGYGEVLDVEDYVLASWAEWAGDAEVFVKSLIKCGLVVMEDGAYRLTMIMEA